MPNPIQNRAIGGVSVLLGIAVLVAGSIFVHESREIKCDEYVISLVDVLIPDRFQHDSDGGGQHGGQNPGFGQNNNGFGQNNNNGFGQNNNNGFGQNNNNGFGQNNNGFGQNNNNGFGGGRSNFGGDDESHDDLGPVDRVRNVKSKLEDCGDVMKKYRLCAIFALVGACLQILISAVYISANKQTFKSMSLGWIGVHFGVVIILITTASIALAEKRLNLEPNDSDARKKFEDDDDLPEKKLGFAIVTLLDAFLLLVFMVIAGLTLKNSDSDSNRDRPVKKKFLES